MESSAMIVIVTPIQTGLTTTAVRIPQARRIKLQLIRVAAGK